MKYKAMNRETEQVEYSIIAKSKREAKTFMLELDPGNEKYLVVEADKYKVVEKVVEKKKLNKVSMQNEGFLKDLAQKQAACET